MKFAKLIFYILALKLVSAADSVLLQQQRYLQKIVLLLICSTECHVIRLL